MQEGRDLWWHDLMAEHSANCPAEPLDSEAPLFILYTSGSTGKPKGVSTPRADTTFTPEKTMEWVFEQIAGRGEEAFFADDMAILAAFDDERGRTHAQVDWAAFSSGCFLRRACGPRHG